MLSRKKNKTLRFLGSAQPGTPERFIGSRDQQSTAGITYQMACLCKQISLAVIHRGIGITVRPRLKGKAFMLVDDYGYSFTGISYMLVFPAIKHSATSNTEIIH